jgi:uncharacterized protein (DUF1810 family)
VTDDFDLARFATAQDRGATYAAALAELRAGRKQSHWMWFVFPQVRGLGRSTAAQYYGISGLAEARAYLAHPVLGPRLVECSRALTDLPSSDPAEVLGQTDAMKLRSSMTLFAHASNDPETKQVFGDVLRQYFDGAEDGATLERL